MTLAVLQHIIMIDIITTGCLCAQSVYFSNAAFKVSMLLLPT